MVDRRIEKKEVVAVSFHGEKKNVHGGKGVIRKYVETETSGGKRTTQ